MVNNFDALPADCICTVSFKEELYSTLSLFNQVYKRAPVTYCPIQGGVAILLGMLHAKERPCQGGSHVARLNFKTSRDGVYKCLSLIVCLAVTVAIWLREVVSCHDFILHPVATFWAMLLVGIYPGRASKETGIIKLWPLGTLVPVHLYLTFTSRLHSWDWTDNLRW